MAIIPSTFKLDWYDPSQPGGVTSDLNDNANTATSNATQYTMEDIINTVSYTGGSIDGSGAEWALPVFTDTNTITNLPLGVAGQHLTSGGPAADPVWADLSAGPYEVGTGTGSAQLIGDASNDAAADYSAVTGGAKNTIGVTAAGSVIGGGEGNSIPTGVYNIIGGGVANVLDGASKDAYNGIFSGAENTIDCNWIASHVGGGGKNRLIDEVGTGKGSASISGGLENRMCVPAAAAASQGIMAGFIGGGLANVITDAAPGGDNCGGFIGGGSGNKLEAAEQYAAIVGGTENCIIGPPAHFSFIGGGKSNEINSASCATILGGEGNTNQCDNAHIIGSNITATRTSTTFVEGFNIGQATPITAYADNAAALLGGLTAGDVYRQTTTAGGDLLGIVH